MQTTLCFDFGNTRLKCGVFNGKELKEVIVLNDDNASAIENIIVQQNASRSILSSVINHNPEIEELLTAKTKFHKLSDQSKLRLFLSKTT